MAERGDLLRALPAVDVVLRFEPIAALGSWRSVVKMAVRQTLEEARAEVLAGGRPDLHLEALAGRVKKAVAELSRPNFRRVVNATGVVIHTNLGRSLLAPSALKAVQDFSRTYTNLEFDLEKGRRGTRYSHVVDLLKELTEAEEAVVVNNNAAAVLLCLNTLALGREVIVSRGQLVEIGGSFRMPEIMARSGAILVEVGATNKTHLSDYRAALSERTALLLKVHQSNFAMVGFQKVVPLAEMVQLARAHNLPVMEDLGSGCLIDLSGHGLDKEPTVAESLKAGADLVTFSGDKMLGGPQAGIILGRAEIIADIQQNPLNRAVRIDKMTLAALEATLRLYRDEPEAMQEIPTLRMLGLSPKVLRTRAARLKKKLAAVGGPMVELGLIKGSSQVGGGALPLQELPTRLVGLRIRGWSSARVEEALRRRPVPIIGRIEQDWFLLDPRTILPEDVEVIVEAVQDILAEA